MADSGTDNEVNLSSEAAFVAVAPRRMTLSQALDKVAQKDTEEDDDELDNSDSVSSVSTVRPMTSLLMAPAPATVAPLRSVLVKGNVIAMMSLRFQRLGTEHRSNRLLAKDATPRQRS